MKCTKAYGIFLITFSIGCVITFASSFFQTTKVEEAKSQRITSDEFRKIVENVEPKLEVFEENLDYRKRSDSEHKIKLIETGEGFHGSEIIAKNYEKWLALIRHGDTFYLSYEKLKVKKVNDPITDNFSWQKNGKNVFLRRNAEALFLLKNANKLEEGEVKTLTKSTESHKSFKIGYNETFEIGKVKYDLQVKKGVNKEGKEITVLVLSDGKKHQVLHSLDGDFEDVEIGSVFWAGDLDRDGKPDFYLDLYYHDNVEWKNLFLSSDAKNEKLVKKVAEFGTTGC